MRSHFAGSVVVALVLVRMASGWFFATYILFLLSHGLNLFEANLVNTTFMVSNTILESPTGYIADRWGQKRSHIAGVLFFSLGMFIYGVSGTVWGFVTAEIVAAAGRCFISGALDSWLLNQTDENTCSKAKSSAAMFGSLATIPTALIGSYLGATYGLYVPWFVASFFSLGVAAVTAIILWPFPDSRSWKKTKEDLPSLLSVYKLVIGIGSLRYVTLLGLVYFLACQPLNMFWPVVFRDRSGEVWWLGAVWMGIAVATSIGAYLGRSRLLTLNGTGLMLVILATGVPIFCAVFVPGSLLLVGMFLLHEIGRGAFEPVFFTYSNRHIPARVRSTANSIRSQAQMVGAAIGLVLSGAMTMLISPLAVWGIAGALLLLLAAYAFLRKE